MERRNLPRKARDIKRNHSEEINFESPKVKKKHSKKQYDKTTEKNLEDMEFSKRNGNKEENDDKTPLNNSYDKTPTITKLMATEENVSLNIKESSKRTKLNDNKNTDAPVTKKKLPSKDKVKVPLKQNVEISANIKTVSLSKGEDAAPLKVLKFQTPVNDVPALKKKKLSSKVKNEKCVPKESVDDDKNNDIPFSKSKNVTSKKKKEIAAKKNKKPSKVVIDSGILATKNKKMPSKELDKLVTNEKGIQKLQNSVETNYANIDFNINELYNTKICSFNVAGIRAFVKKGGHEYFEKERPDIICLQVYIQLLIPL